MSKNKAKIPEDKRKKCNAIIHSASVAAGGVGTGLAQIPLADNAAITPIQIGMIISLGEVFNQHITKAVATSILGGVTASFVGRGISQVLVGWIPGVGNAVNTLTAPGITEAIGWKVAYDFSVNNYGDHLSNEKKANKEDDEISKETLKKEKEELEKSIDDLHIQERADEFISGRKNKKDNKEEYNQLCVDMEHIMPYLREDHPLQAIYEKLIHIS